MKLTMLLLSVTSLLNTSFAQVNTANPIVAMTTSLGAIEIELYQDKAPITASNFLRYVTSGKYDQAVFYRSVRLDNQVRDDILIQVIQGGIYGIDSLESFDAIEHETTEKTGILHKDGVISMARLDPGTASSEIFICIGDQPSLDYGGMRNPDGQGFAAFGRVISGMDVVHQIHKQPTEAESIIEPVRILKARLKN